MKYEVIYFIQIISASLSARRVWIEIRWLRLAERNTTSLSARRVWIEILVGSPSINRLNVTLREEGVD